jgi:hypothetical protein
MTGVPRGARANADFEGWLDSQLAGQTLRAADEILDDARRVLWFAAFSGRKVAALRKPGASGSIAAEIAARLDDMPLSAAMEIIERHRRSLWESCLPGHRPFDDDERPKVQA